MGERHDIGGRSLYALRRGSGEPLLLVQGMSGTHAAWGEPFLSALDDGFDVVAYDHRGIGRSDPADGPFAITDLADDAVALLDALGIPDAHVLGISMGGMVAQEIALRHPGRVRTLALGCTYAGGAGAALTDEATMSRLAEAMMSGDRERAIRTGYEINVSQAFAADDANWEPFRAMATAVPAPLPTIMLQLQAIVAHDAQERLAQIAHPTVVVHGDEDRMLPVANASLIAGAIPDARLEILEGIGHLFWWEAPERAAELLRAHALTPA